MAYYKRIRDIREDSDMTQAQVADLLFVNRRTYSCYETGTHMMPLEILGKLADLFNTSVDYLMGRTDEKNPYSKSKKPTHFSRTIDVTGLTDEQIQHIQNFIDDLKSLQANDDIE
jgi:transcriptional regulator with XRE-family HTH domain